MEDGDIAHLNEFLLLPEGYLHLWALSPPHFTPRPLLQNHPLAEEDREGAQKAQDTNSSFSSFLPISKRSFSVKLDGVVVGKA